jgi:hypothetical protein
VRKILALGCLMILSANAFAGSTERAAHGSATLIHAQQMAANEDQNTGVVVYISNGLAPQEALGELVIKDSGETLAVMSLPAKVPALYKLDQSCDYIINYKELRFGIAVTAIAQVPNSCGQERLQAR